MAVTGNSGIAIHLHAENLSTTEVAFYRFEGAMNQNPIELSQMEKLEGIEYSELLQSQTQLSIEVHGENLTLRLDGKIVLSAIVPQLNQAGAVGVQFPQNALLRNISIKVD